MSLRQGVAPELLAEVDVLNVPVLVHHFIAYAAMHDAQEADAHDAWVPLSAPSTLEAHGGEVEVKHLVLFHALQEVLVEVVVLQELAQSGYVSRCAVGIGGVLALPCALPFAVGIPPVVDAYATQQRVGTILLVQFADGHNALRVGVLGEVAAVVALRFVILQRLYALQDAIPGVFVETHRVILKLVHHPHTQPRGEVGEIAERSRRVRQCLREGVNLRW